MKESTALFFALLSLLLGAMYGYVTFEPPRAEGDERSSQTTTEEEKRPESSSDTGEDGTSGDDASKTEAMDPAPHRKAIEEAKSLYEACRFFDAALALERPLSRLAGVSDDEVVALREEAEELRDRCHVFWALTREVPTGAFRTGEGLKKVTLVDGGVMVVKPRHVEERDRFAFVTAGGAKESLAYEKIEAIEEIKPEAWQNHARKLIRKRREETPEPTALSDYQLARYALQLGLEAEAIEHLESAIRRDGAEILLPNLCEGETEELRYKILMAAGRRDEALAFRKQTLAGRTKTEGGGSITEPTFEVEGEEGESKATGFQAAPEYDRVNELLTKAMKHYERSMPGMPREDEELAKAKALFEELQTLLEALAKKYEDPELDEKRFLVQKHLYDCMKRTKLK